MFSSVLDNNNFGISSVQTSLNDFFGGLPPFRELVSDRLFSKVDLDYDFGVHALGNGYFENSERVCPYCGKSDKKVNKKDFRKRIFIKENFGRVTVFLRRYYCKHCDIWFKTNFEKVVNAYERITSSFKENIREKSKTGRKSLRGTSRDYMVDDIPISHQSIQSILNEEKTDEMSFDIGELSGYYVFDEQHPKINGIEMRKAQLIDVVKNQTFAVKIFDKSTTVNIKNFLKKHIPKNKRFGITTDHKPVYNKVIEELNFDKRQKCIFHFGKIISNKVDEGIKGKNFTKDELYEIDYYTFKIKKIFSTYDINTAYESLYFLLMELDQIPEFLQEFINNKVIKEWNELTCFMIDYNIPKTSNKVETSFRNSQHGDMKKQFKTTWGNINYIKPKLQYQNERFGLKKEFNSPFYG
jgi:hypothetical protein